jgi:hypothetical protein
MNMSELNQPTLSRRSICAFALTVLLTVASSPLTAQTSGAKANPQAGGMSGEMEMAPAKPGEPLPSPAATANVTVAGGTIDIKYNTPKMRGRKIMGELVPYDKVWRTGANPATTVITSVPLKFGDVLVPAGTHTLYTLPSAGTWQLILNKQTGQWGTVYQQSMDLGRTPMKAKPMTAPQEVMSISFENTTSKSTELHVRWETTDEYVTVTAP